jgi:hypothetical protein
MSYRQQLGIPRWSEMANQRPGIKSETFGTTGGRYNRFATETDQTDEFFCLKLY